MRDTGWYLRRAVPWSPVLGAVGLVVALIAAAHRWEEVEGLALTLAALVTVAAAALVYDDAAVAVTAVTPRARWAQWARLAAGVAVLALGGAVLLTGAGHTDRSDWALAVAALGGATLLVALVGRQRQVPRPGTPVASGVVLLGLAPLVVGLFLDLGSPYPAPGLTDAAATRWGVVAAVVWIALAVRLDGRWLGGSPGLGRGLGRGLGLGRLRGVR